MKLIYGIIWIALLGSFSSSNHSATLKNDCGCGLEELVKEYDYTITQDRIQIKELSDSEINTIRNMLCMNIISATPSGFKPNEFKKVIIDVIGEEKM